VTESARIRRTIEIRRTWTPHLERFTISDVVSADSKGWTYPPYEGMIADGFIWGRYTLEIKNQLLQV
jgi:hypothetical protein